MARRIIQILLLLVACESVAAQRRVYSDDKLFHFGFLLGVNLMDYKVKESMDVLDNGEQYYVRESNLTPGFSVGLIGDIRLCRYLNLRFTPTFHFSQRTLSYKTVSGGKKGSVVMKTEVLSMPIEFPLLLKYSALRHKNAKVYILGGGGVSYDVSRDKKRMLLMKPLDYFVTVGAGCDIYLPFFKLGPEIRFSLGFNNVLTPISERPEITLPEQQRYTMAIKRVTNRMITLIFNFE